MTFNNETINRAYELKEAKKWLNEQTRIVCGNCLHLLDDSEEVCENCGESENISFLTTLCDCELLKICNDCGIVAEEENDLCKICPCKSAWC